MMLPGSAETLIFGDSFQRAIERICGEGMRVNTLEGWKAADEQLHGLEILVGMMRDKCASPHFLHLDLRIMAHRLAISRIAGVG